MFCDHSQFLSLTMIFRRKGKCEGGPPCTWCTARNIPCVPQLGYGKRPPIKEASAPIVTISHPYIELEQVNKNTLLRQLIIN